MNSEQKIIILIIYSIFLKRVLVIATGLSTPNVPANVQESSEGYEEFSTDPSEYEGKSVLILGRGNSAFETAQAIYGVTNLVHMVSRSRIRNAYQTHYVGDLRALNNELLDTYQLKSLDGFLDRCQ
jgi:thioredoxin reductase